MKKIVMRLVIAVVVLVMSLRGAGAEEPAVPELYAFENGVPAVDFARQAELLKELGYAGVSQVSAAGGQARMRERVRAYNRLGLRVLSIYLAATETPIERSVVASLPRGGLIELFVPQRNSAVVHAIRDTATMAESLGLRVVIYPHFGMAVATMPEAVALVEEVGHANVGIMFNLCHYLRSESAETLEATLRGAREHLVAVSTCGADVDGQDWQALIRPLDQGTFSQVRLLKALRAIDFQGPIGLQCYGLKGDRAEHLRASSKAWRTIVAELD